MLQKIYARRLKRAPIVISVCLALFAGIGLARYYPGVSFGWLWPVGVLVAVTLRKHNVATLLCLALLGFGIGWWRGSVVMYRMAPYSQLALTKVTVVGRATDDAVYGEQSQLTFGLSVVHVVQPVQTALPGTLKVSGYGVGGVYRGDRVVVSGKLYPTRGSNQASISFAELKIVERGSSGIDAFRRNFAAGLQSALPEPLASLGLGLLIGQRSTLPAEVTSVLLTVGLTHIIAVSGYNLTIIIQAVRRLMGKRSKFQTMAVCLLLMGTFLLITGSSPSIVRASIISMLSLGVWYYGRTIKPLVLLLTAGAISVLLTPLYLWGNVSWYLSFLAFFGVLVLAPLVTKRLYGRRTPKIIGQIVIESSCAQIMTVPYVLYIFGHISFVALPANVLVVAAVPLAMLLSLIAGLAGMFMPIVAGWLAWPAACVLLYMLDVSSLLAELPFAARNNTYSTATAMACAYGVIGFVAVLLWRRAGSAS
ncbi:MAG TPA: ComEC/Rec2 family competence protein [Candidatus Saccharimonadales bacterium]|nr:ComEC/Rec2 family competence protein [Candidatus Saccharimonadales bacterium]